MEYHKLGRTGIRVSELCLGTMTFGWTTDETNSYQVLNAAFDGGINFVDTADVYSRWHPGNPGGVAETYIGNWLRGRPRDQVILATKVRAVTGDGPNDQGLSRGHILNAVEGSLRRLRTDYIDLYQPHFPDDETPIEETLRVLDDLVTQGKVRYLGVSNFRAWRVVQALWASDKHAWARIECVQPHYNLVWRAEFERELRDVCRAEGLGVIPYSPLQGGFLTGKYRRGAPMPRGARGEGNDRMTRFVAEERNMTLLDSMETIAKEHGGTIAQVATAWLLADPIITSPIVGANTAAQIGELLGAATLKLSAEDKKTLDDLTAWQLET